MPKLIVKHPERGEMTFPLSGDRITVGRRGDNQIQINHGTISGHHAELVSVNGHYVLRDLDSTNHCFVDGFQISEADLSDRCKVLIGTIECEYIPDDPAAPAGELENLRKTVGLLRAQNEELVAKLNDQQKHIDILGSARLLTPATGADLIALREKVGTLTAERERLLKENQTLTGEVERLRVIAARRGEPATLKATEPITLPGEADTVSVGPGGAAVLAAPMAKVAARDPVVEVSPQLVEFCNGLKPMLTQLGKEPGNERLRTELAAVTERMAERAAVIASHPVARLITSFDALVRDVGPRPEALTAGVQGALKDATALLDEALAPELLHRAKTLPLPRILVAADDDYLLPPIVAALEFSRFQATSCTSGDEALTLLKDAEFDVALLGTIPAGATPEDAFAGLRALPNGKKLPVVYFTGEGSPRPPGSDDGLAKPLNTFELTLKAQVWALKRQLQLA